MLRLAVVAALSVGLLGPAHAHSVGAATTHGTLATVDEVLKGTLVCAKCELKRDDAHECQDVLLVERANGATAEYYITKNEVAEKSGEACTLKIPATVTGAVSQRDGKTWLTPTKIEKHEKR